MFAPPVKTGVEGVVADPAELEPASKPDELPVAVEALLAAAVEVVWAALVGTVLNTETAELEIGAALEETEPGASDPDSDPD